MHGRIVLAAIILPLLATGCVERIEQSQVKSALVNAGLAPATSQCMAHRMVDQLTIRQLRKLEALQGPKRSVGDYIVAVQRVNDPQVMRVTISSAALCLTGWER